MDVALVWVGHNDLFIRTYIGYAQDGGQQAFFGALITKIVTAAATLRAYASLDPQDIKAKVAIIGLAGTASALNPALSAAAASAGITFIDPFNTAVSAIVNEQATTGSYDVAGTDLLPFTFVYPPTFSATPKVASAAESGSPRDRTVRLQPRDERHRVRHTGLRRALHSLRRHPPEHALHGRRGQSDPHEREHHVRVRDADDHRDAATRHCRPVASKEGRYAPPLRFAFTPPGFRSRAAAEPGCRR